MASHEEQSKLLYRVVEKWLEEVSRSMEENNVGCFFFFFFFFFFFYINSNKKFKN